MFWASSRSAWLGLVGMAGIHTPGKLVMASFARA